MPVRTLRTGASAKAKRAHASRVIREVSHGKTVAQTKRKFGAARARKQAIAIGLAAAGLLKRKKRTKKK